MTQAAELLPPAEEAPGTTIVEYSATVAALADLDRRIGKTVYDVSTTKLLEAAKKDRAEVRGYRVALENKRVEIKAPALERCRQIDTEARRITADLERIEAIPDAAIKAEEARKEREREAKIQAEVARVAAIHERVAELRGNQMLTPADGSKLIGEHVADLQAIAVDESFAEFRDLAASTKQATLERLQKLLDAARAHEAEQERLRLEREDLAKQRAEQEQANIESRRRIALEEAEAKRKREAEEAAAATERKLNLDRELSKLRAEREENERLAKEQRESAAAEQRHIEEENERQAELARARWGEIQAMGHQVMIASVGRIGVRKGGTRECIVDTLAETEAWTVTEDKFGPLLPAALSARTNACDQIRAALAAFDQSAQQSHFREQLQRQQDALAAERAEFERQQADLAKPVAQVAPATEPDLVSDLSTDLAGTIELPASDEFAPTANDIIGIVRSHYEVTFEQALVWCFNAFDRTDSDE